MSLVRPRELQLPPQGARILQRLVALDVVAADRGQFDARADRFEQRRFARTVLAYEESHRRMELEMIEFFDQRQIERKARSLLRRGFQADRLKMDHNSQCSARARFMRWSLSPRQVTASEAEPVLAGDFRFTVSAILSSDSDHGLQIR